MALVALLAALIGSAVIASPAQAVACNSGTFCLFNGTDGTGLMYAPRISDTPRTRCIALPSGVNNRTGYVRNRAAEQILVYDNATCSSAIGVIHANSQGPMRSPWVDSISSWCRCGPFA